jgi:ATP-dependent Clp protease ATP-binding subunit ClpC
MSDFSEYNLTPSAKKALMNARQIADEMNHLKTTDAHLFISILEDDHILLDHCFRNCFVKKDLVVDTMSALLVEYKERKRKYKIFSKEIKEILSSAQKVASALDSSYVGVDHIFVAMLEMRQDICAFLESININASELKTSIIDALSNGIEQEKATTNPTQQPKQKQKDVSEILASCCEVLNETIGSRGTYEIFGREKEINRSFEVLLRKNKSNIILVGEPGVGKTAIVEGMVEKILQRKAPDFLLHKQFLSLDLSGLVSGTMYRGQMEEKVKVIIDFLRQHEECVLFIDEIHTVIGAGSSEGGLDFANMLKPYLSRGEISCIGATTKEEYEKYFKKDGALNRRFEKIDVKEPTKKETLKLLKSAKKSYESYHTVEYSDTLIEVIVNLCEKYLPEKKFPDKAFDILDEAGAKTKKLKIKRPQKAIDMESKLIDKEFQKDDKKYKEYETKYKDILYDWGQTLKDTKHSVTGSVVYQIFADKLGISVKEIKSGQNIPNKNRIGFH